MSTNNAQNHWPRPALLILGTGVGLAAFIGIFATVRELLTPIAPPTTELVSHSPRLPAASAGPRAGSRPTFKAMESAPAKPEPEQIWTEETSAAQPPTVNPELPLDELRQDQLQAFRQDATQPARVNPETALSEEQMAQMDQEGRMAW